MDKGSAQSPGEGQVFDSEAEYTLEYPVSCPSCHEIIKTVQAVRLLRTRINFTSTLPRHGRAIVCPGCRGILSVTLTIA